MNKNKQVDFFILLFFLIICSYSEDIIEYEFGQIRRGTLASNEYDYYFLTLPKDLDKDSYLIIELEPTKYYDHLCNIISDPNLYVSMTEKMPSINSNTWKSERFGDETISISPSFLSPQQNIYISVHCIEKCNYMLKAQLVKDIPIQEKGSFDFILNPKTVTKFSFTTRGNFDELNLNIISSKISSFNAYLAKENPSSSNTLPATPIFFNGYRFTINNQDTPNANTKYHLIIDNEDERQELTIWLQYDNEKILVKETNILYDSISENKAHCYNYPIDYFNENKEIIISITLFNGQGFIYMAGYNPINANSIKLADKNKNTNYIVIQNKVIRLTKDNFKNFGMFVQNEKNFLNFCFYAERNTSLSINAYFYENYMRLQDLNIVYAGIGIEDILPKLSLKKYKLEHFNIDQDITFFLEIKYGNPKLYLFMANPGEENLIINNNDFEKYKRNNQILEAKHIHNKYNLYLTKELNKCKLNEKTGLYPCYLRAIIECQGEEDCTYSFSFDHSKALIIMKPKITYSNVISENEYDYYKIIIPDVSVKNLVIVLMQNTGNTLLRLDSFTSESNELKLNEEAQNNQFLPNLIKISCEKLKRDNLKGIFDLKVKGLSYASYSLYYYSFNIEENIDQLDYDKVSMKLEKGTIIKDIFMDTHRFKVYMYDSSIIGNKTNLFIGLVETNYINLELYVFKDLNDFSIYDEKINGYLWKGDAKDYIYIDKNDKKYIENNILYIMIFKKQNYHKEDEIEDTYTPFYLGITDENTPLLLNDGVEFKYQLNTEHPSQKFYYYFVDNGEKDQDLQISISLYYGHVLVIFEIENKIYQGKYVFDESDLITIKREDILKYCTTKKECGITIEVKNDDSFLQYSSFLISVRNSKNTPIYLKQGNTNKRTILTGEDQYFIIDLKPDKSFGAKISVMFINGQGEIYARRLLRNEIFQNNIFPDDINFEYMAGYKNMDNGLYLIEIPYRDFEDHSYCRVLLTVRGIFPGHYKTKIEYSISVSNFLYEILTEKNYRFFISQGEISNFHFKVGPNKKRLYVSMTNKDKDANMFLTSETLMPNIYQYEWRSSGGYNEYIDISVSDPYFIERGINDVDGDYYLVIHGIEDTFYNLYISSQDVKIMTIKEDAPGVCSCETENDNCYFRYENMDNSISKLFDLKKLVFYTEYTYGSGAMSAKLYKNGNMDEILKNLPSKNNHDAFTDDTNEYLFMEIKPEDPKYTFNSVVVVGVQCKQKSLFDLTVTLLDSKIDVSRNEKNLIYLKLNQDNIFYLSSLMGINTKFMYYVFKNENLNFNIKALLGKAQIHTYTNKSSIYYNYLDEEVDIDEYISDYKHISDFIVDKNTKGKNDYYGMVKKEYGYKNDFCLEIKPIEDCLINININYENEMTQIPLNKEVIGVLNGFNYYGYFDFKPDLDEIVITITSLEKNMQYDVYLKTNVINRDKNTENDIDNKYSKPSSQNYDLKGKTNPLTLSISFRIQNVPKIMRTEAHVVRILINIDPYYKIAGQKLKILVTPVINQITRIRPQQNMYYFSNIEQRIIEKAVFNLKNVNTEDNLMIIEVSSCKGNFIYTLTDTPPLDKETYSQLQNRKIPSNVYNSNGKSIITVRNLEEKNYYLTLFGGNSDINIINENEEKKVDVLFYYYTTNEKKYNYLVTQDSLIYESKDNFYSLKLYIPEIKKRDTLGKENNVNSMNYTLIVSDQKTDFDYMESTCYLAKLDQNNQISKFENLQVEFDKNSNAFNIKGLEEGKTYYMNILGKNLNTGEVITYKPVVIVYSGYFSGGKIALIIILVIVLLLFLYIAFLIYRKYRLKKLQLNFVEENNSENSFDKKVGKKSNINLDFVKKKYNNLSEDNNEINDN